MSYTYLYNYGMIVMHTYMISYIYACRYYLLYLHVYVDGKWSQCQRLLFFILYTLYNRIKCNSRRWCSCRHLVYLIGLVIVQIKINDVHVLLTYRHTHKVHKALRFKDYNLVNYNIDLDLFCVRNNCPIFSYSKFIWKFIINIYLYCLLKF